MGNAIAAQPSSTTTLEALEQVAKAAERSFAARIELALFQAKTAAKTTLRSAGIGAAAFFVGALAWLFVVVGAALMLKPRLGPGVATFVVGLGQAVVSVVLLLLAKKDGEEEDEDANEGARP